MKRLLLLTAVLLTLAFEALLVLPAPAAAMTEDQAAWRGIVQAHEDCTTGSDPNGVWLCAGVEVDIGVPFPKSYGVARCDDTSRWCVEVLYAQYDFTWPRTQLCITRTHWRVEGDVDMTFHSEGCFGTAPAPGRARIKWHIGRMT